MLIIPLTITAAIVIYMAHLIFSTKDRGRGDPIVQIFDFFVAMFAIPLAAAVILATWLIYCLVLLWLH